MPKKLNKLPKLNKVMPKGKSYLKYGLTEDEYIQMKELSGNRCYICNQSPKKKALCIDHDHHLAKTLGIHDSVRGLICFNCNRYLIGKMGDRLNAVELFNRASEYISKHRNKIKQTVSQPKLSLNLQVVDLKTV